VTAIRDPVSHFLAGYNEEETRCFDNRVGVNACPNRKHSHLYSRYKPGTKQHFEQFVADFLGGSTRAGAGMNYRHVYSMTGWLYKLAQQKEGLKLSAYLPTLANLTETFPPFLVNSCPGIPEALRTRSLEPLKNTHTSQADPFEFHKGAKKVWMEEGPTARALCALHAIDYACFEHLPGGIPNICKHVLVSSDFRNRVFGDNN
jgi:hypothetical protein